MLVNIYFFGDMTTCRLVNMYQYFTEFLPQIASYSVGTEDISLGGKEAEA